MGEDEAIGQAYTSLDFSASCPVCNGRMEKKNKYCSLFCYKAANTEAHKDEKEDIKD